MIPDKPPQAANDPRQRLIEATIGQIEQHGVGKVTVRGVAGAADLNVASVNYYFRSKQALLEAALEGAILHMVEDCQGYLKLLPDDPQAVLAELLGYILEGALRYPQLSRAHLHEAFMEDKYEGPFPVLFRPVIKDLRDALCRIVPDLSKSAASRRVVAALSSVFFPAFFLALYPFETLKTAGGRQRYVREVAVQALVPA